MRSEIQLSIEKIYFIIKVFTLDVLFVNKKKKRKNVIHNVDFLNIFWAVCFSVCKFNCLIFYIFFCLSDFTLAWLSLSLFVNYLYKMAFKTLQFYCPFLHHIPGIRITLIFNFIIGLSLTIMLSTQTSLNFSSYCR